MQPLLRYPGCILCICSHSFLTNVIIQDYIPICTFFLKVHSSDSQKLFSQIKKNVPRHIRAPRAVACDNLHLRASAHLRHTVPFCLQEVPSEFPVSKKDSPLSGCPLFYICLSNFEKSYEFMLTRMIRQVIHAFGIKFLLRNRKHLIYGLRIQAVVVYKVLVLHQLFLPLVLSALRVLPAMVSSVRLPDTEMMDDREFFGKLQ